MKKIQTVCILHRHPKVLLGMKKRGFGEGRWNGFGGKVEKDETIEEAVVREMKEEAGIDVSGVTKHGVLDFTFEDNDDQIEVHFFRTTEHKGEPTESEEMRPEWYHIDDIPYKSMWPDDKYWLPHLLEEKYFRGAFHFGGPNDDVLEHTLEFVQQHEL